MSLVYGIGWRDETKTQLDELRDTFFENGQLRFISEDETEKHKKHFNFICIDGGCLYNGRCMLKSDAEKTLQNIIAQFFCLSIMFLTFLSQLFDSFG